MCSEINNCDQNLKHCRSTRGIDETHGLCSIKTLSGMTMSVPDAMRRGHLVCFGLSTAKTAERWCDMLNSFSTFMEQTVRMPGMVSALAFESVSSYTVLKDCAIGDAAGAVQNALDRAVLKQPKPAQYAPTRGTRSGTVMHLTEPASVGGTAAKCDFHRKQAYTTQGGRFTGDAAERKKAM